MNIAEVKKTVAPILKKYDIKRAAVFGSVARGQATKESDVDLLIDVGQPMGLMRFAKLQYTLEDALRTPVDLVKFSMIKPEIRERVLQDAVTIYG